MQFETLNFSTISLDQFSTQIADFSARNEYRNAFAAYEYAGPQTTTNLIEDQFETMKPSFDFEIAAATEAADTVHESLDYCCCSGCGDNGDGVNSTVYDIPPMDYTSLTIPGDNTTTEIVTQGGMRQETLETVGDTDWFRLDFTAGSFTIDLIGLDHDAGNGLGALTDTFLRVYDAAGGFLFDNDDGGPGLFSSITLNAGGSGTIYVEAAAFDGLEAGDYQLSVSESFTPITPPAPTPGTPLEALQGSTQLDDSGPIMVYYSVVGDEYDRGDTTYTATGVNAYEQGQLQSIFDVIETMVDIDFQVTTVRADADLEWATAVLPSTGGGTLLGFFNFPSSSGQGGFGVLNNDGPNFPFWNSAPGGTLDTGGFMYGTAIHEIGHGLGLGHPHDSGNGTVTMQGVTSSSDRGDFNLNSSPYTVMSYNEGWVDNPAGQANSISSTGQAASFGALDVAALQAVYGANATYNNGNDTYTLFDSDATGTGAGYYTTWDTGGTDEFVYVGTKDTTIDLREATLQYEDGGGGFMSFVNGVIAGRTIAAGVEIENATGGDGDDTLTGNTLGNVLNGGVGTDSLFGLAGQDTLIGGAGADALDGGNGLDWASYADAAARVVLNLTIGSGTQGDAAGDTYTSIERVQGSDFNDIMTAGATSTLIRGGLGNDVVRSGAGDDDLRGDEGNDTIYGGAGADDIRGGSGNDLLWYRFSTEAITIDMDNSAANSGDAAGDTLLLIERVRGSDYDDSILGRDVAQDRLFGGDGNDTLSGRGGNDYLFGGEGADVHNGGDGIDYASYFNATVGVTLDLSNLANNTGEAAGDTFNSIERFFGSLLDDVFTGDDTDNFLRTNIGNDTLNGLGGNDRLYGEGGDDTIDGGAGIDRILGGEGNDTMTGGSGRDAYYFEDSAGTDTITDWTSGEDRMIFLNSSGANAFGDLTITDEGTHVEVSYAEGTIILDNVGLGDVAASDFVFL
jgi:serralysin